MSQDVRDLVAGMLESTHEYGAGVLLEQLGSSREQYWGDPAEFNAELYFVVTDDAPRTVPRNYTFPVHADFVNADGQPVRASLMIQDGRLDALVLDVAHERMVAAHEDDRHPFEGVTDWPLPSEVSYLLEG